VNLATGVSLGGTAYGDQFLDHIEVFAGSRFADVFTGGSANDSFLGGDGNDTLSGGAGTNHLDGGNGNDVMHGGAGADTFMGGAGSDRLYYTDSAAGVHVDMVAGIGSGGDAAGDHYLDSFESITGSVFNDVLAGGNNTVALSGGAGDDVMSAGPNPGPTTFLGGDGFDTVSYANCTTAVSIDLLDKTVAGGAAGDVYQYIEAFTGSAFNDTMISGTGNTDTHYYLNGGDGNDTLTAGQGAESNFDGGNGDDVLDGGYRDDILIGGAEADILRGHEGEDVLDGGAGNDTLIGGVANVDEDERGDDFYTGNNTLTGGAGADHFVFEARDDFVKDGVYRDIITDFSGAEGDKIDLSQIVSSINFIGTGAFTGVADQLRYEYDAAHNQTLVGLDRDGDGKADYGTTLDGNVTLTAGDFLV
jgi:Ca2+-binding RTX toxin-like protein